jgi:ribonuclease HI
MVPWTSKERVRAYSSSPPQGDHLKYVLQIDYKASNNGAEYDALIHGLHIVVSLKIKRLISYGDSKVVIDLVNKVCDIN